MDDFKSYFLNNDIASSYQLPYKSNIMRIILFFIAVMQCSLLVAQHATVNGVVTNTAGEILPGVSIVEKGTSKSTVTNKQGKYKIGVSSADATLVFTYLGYNPLELNTGGKSTLDVQLSALTKNVDEVVVIGYGTVKRKELTGSVASVTGDDLSKVPVQDVATSLAGRLAGVQVAAAEGAPGGEISIKVRGGGSITQSNEPLYVVDGIPQTEGLSFLDPTDIESIDVLKDAASTAIYGARGANGVILVTTKQQKGAKTAFTYDNYFGVKKNAKTLPTLSPYDYTLLQYERSLVDATRLASFKTTYGEFKDLQTNYGGRSGVDWQSEVFGRAARNQYHKIGVNGGSKETKYNMFYSYNQDEGIMLNSGANKNVMKLTLNHNVNKKFRVEGTANYAIQKVFGIGTGEGNQNFNQLQNILTYRPTFGLAGEDSDLIDLEEDPVLESNAGNVQQNPIINALSQNKEVLAKTLNLNGGLQYKLTDQITYKGLVNYRNTSTKSDLFYDKRSMTAKRTGGPQGALSDQVRNGWSYTNTLTYTGQLGQDHKFDVLLGQEQNYLMTKFNKINAKGFPEETLGLDNLYEAGSFTAESNKQDEKMLSFFARGNYNFRSKYLLSASIRADGSSKFGLGNKYGYFPAISGAWRIIEESFMHDQRVFSDLKLRLSLGTSGNNRVANYASLALLAAGVYPLLDQNNVTVYPDVLPNPNLRWEKTKSENIGLDMAFFNQRIQLTTEFYRNTTNDLLLSSEVPMTSGYSTMLVNAGSTRNSGIELSLNTININGSEFRWTTNFNMAFNSNKVLALAKPSEKTRYAFSNWGILTESDYIVRVGESLGQIYGYKTDGLYQVDEFNFDSATQVYKLKDGVPFDGNNAPQPGFQKFVDSNGDGKINADDRVVLGNATPKHTGGINNTFTYKGVDLSVFFNWSFGNSVYNANKLFSSQTQLDYKSAMEYFADRWMTIDANGTVVKDPTALAALNQGKAVPVYNSASALKLYDYVIEDGSFLRLNNISLGYTLPKHLISKLKINGLRIYATATNIATITGYSGYDPEVSMRNVGGLTPGVDFGAYPRSRSFVAGLNLSF